MRFALIPLLIAARVYAQAQSVTMIPVLNGKSAKDYTAAVLVSGGAYPEIDGVYYPRGFYRGYPYYVMAGYQVDPTSYQVPFLGVVDYAKVPHVIFVPLGSPTWRINGTVLVSGDMGDYEAFDGATPDKASRWYNTGGNQSSPNQISVTSQYNTTPGFVAGVPSTGATLSADAGVWTIDPQSYTYQWYSYNPSDATGGANPIVGATSSTYTVQPGDLGSAIKVNVQTNDPLTSFTLDVLPDDLTTETGAKILTQTSQGITIEQ